ncbi:MAG: saccharopine dehydrogenase family protein [Omnitrophica WOR_2 bacterium]
MPSVFLLYGSTGYTGNLVASQAVQRGLHPILAGRNAAKVEAQADQLGLDFRVLDLQDLAALERAVGETAAVLLCAGPFTVTSRPVLDACLKTGAHYLDVSGEIPVFEMLAASNERAKARGITLLPGTGIEITATDCLAAHLKQRLPSATHLALAWVNGYPVRNFSRGSMTTMIEHNDYGGRVRQNGELVVVSLSGKTRRIDFGYGPVKARLFPWPDVFAAFYSTGIQNIETYQVLPGQVEWMVVLQPYLGPLFRLAPVKSLLKRAIRLRSEGPDPGELAGARALVWGEVSDDQGRLAVSRLAGPEAYAWTAITALDAVKKVLAGSAPAGFQTPSLAFGADFVLQSSEVRREDVQ